LLRGAASRRTGLVQLARELRVGPARLIALLRHMQEEGLVETGEARSGRVGRPKILVQATELGRAYLKAYDSLISTALKSREADLDRAVEDAEYAARLTAAGNSPYDLFLELNNIVNPAGKRAE
jgi:DNA-binding PadR family transcriptional regulator